MRPEHASHSQRRCELLGASLCLATGRGGQDGSVEQAQTVEHEALVPVPRPVDQTGHVDLRVGTTAVHAALRSVFGKSAPCWRADFCPTDAPVLNHVFVYVHVFASYQIS